MQKTSFFGLVSLFMVTGLCLSAQNKITGKLADGSNNRPLEFAQIALMDHDSSLVAGAVSDLSGSFEIATNQTGDFLLRSSYVGYEEHWMPLTVNHGANRLGTISLMPGAVGLDEVQVSAAAVLFRSEADKRVFNVENMTISEGGTAIQLLETLPSVQVDEEGRISLRGSGNILIYINGRPVNLLSDDTESILEQYPANAIKEVELITNPSARYDAEGIGGIINIVLKDGRRQGLNGQLNASAATGHKYTAGFNLNYRNNRFNFSSGYSYQYRELWEETHSFRERFDGVGSPVLDHDYHNRNFTQGHLFRNSLDYELGENSSLRLFTNMNHSARERERTYNIRSIQSLSALDSLYVRYLDEDQSSINIETGLAYAWHDNGRSLNFMASYAYSQQWRIEYFDQLFFDHTIQEVATKRVDQTYERPIKNQLWLFQLDYEQPLFENYRLETGLKSTLRPDEREQVFNVFDFEKQEYVLDDWVTNQFRHDEQIHAAYVILRSPVKGRWSYLAGLRAEQTITQSYQPRIDSTFNYNYFSLFPSLFVNYALGENRDLQFNVARRIRRPSVTSLQPFINAQDFFNLRLGNPYLQPEYTISTELNYIQSWERYMLSAGLFNRHTVNALSRVFVLVDNATMVTWTNANTQSATGMEVVNYLYLNSNMDATVTANFYHAEVSGTGEGGAFSNQSYSWSVSLLGNANLPGWFSTQLAANYQGPQVIPNGKVQAVFSMNIGLRRNIMNQRGTISLNLTDVFNSRNFSLVTENERFYQLREFTRESRIATLSFTYRFQGYTERAAENRRVGFEGDIEGLY
jgi:iron complex outermembrane recepter protein